LAKSLEGEDNELAEAALALLASAGVMASRRGGVDAWQFAPQAFAREELD
jgi:hypothetical protein